MEHKWKRDPFGIYCPECEKGGRHLVCRIYSKKLGGHVHVRVFSNMVPNELRGKDVTLACAGTLTFGEEEWPSVASRLRQGGFDLREDQA